MPDPLHLPCATWCLVLTLEWCVQWDAQAMISRVNDSLLARGYLTWFDLTNMKGSTMDAMSDAIEGADVMLCAFCSL